MILTKKQACTRWCPFTRVGNDAGCNRNDVEFRASSYCIASNCMAWRELDAPYAEKKIEAIKRRREENGDSLIEAKDYVESHPEYRKRLPADCGFCGLAGKAT